LNDVVISERQKERKGERVHGARIIDEHLIKATQAGNKDEEKYYPHDTFSKTVASGK